MRLDENIIKEKRTIEATKKEYIGNNGKIAIICKNLGEEIIDQGSNGGNFVTYDDFWTNNQNEIKYLSEDTPISSLGYYFYGLNYSCNIEIFYFETERKIEVKNESQTVYLEYNNELECFVPGEWENKIQSLYLIADKKNKETKLKEKEKIKKVFEDKKYKFLSYIKNKWGI